MHIKYVYINNHLVHTVCQLKRQKQIYKNCSNIEIINNISDVVISFNFQRVHYNLVEEVPLVCLPLYLDLVGEY